MIATYMAIYQGTEPAEGYHEQPEAIAFLASVTDADGRPVAASARIRIGKKFARLGLRIGDRFQFQSGEIHMAGNVAVFGHPHGFHRKGEEATHAEEYPSNRFRQLRRQ